jgi:hypothetical protein
MVFGCSSRIYNLEASPYLSWHVLLKTRADRLGLSETNFLTKGDHRPIMADLNYDIYRLPELSGYKSASCMHSPKNDVELQFHPGAHTNMHWFSYIFQPLGCCLLDQQPEQTNPERKCQRPEQMNPERSRQQPEQTPSPNQYAPALKPSSHSQPGEGQDRFKLIFEDSERIGQSLVSPSRFAPAYHQTSQSVGKSLPVALSNDNVLFHLLGTHIIVSGPMI